MARSAQDWLLWLDHGPGGRWMRRLAWLVAIVLVSVVLCYKQFHGPTDERTLAQLTTSRLLAEGKGYSTLVHHPQALALVEARGGTYVLDEAVPELYQPPGYSTLVSAAFRVLPSSLQERVFHTVLPPPNGFVADYVVLGVNVVLLWLALYFTWRLGLLWFEDHVAGWAVWGVLVSSPLWAGTVAGTGVAMVAIALVALALLLTKLHASPQVGRKYSYAASAGAVGGLLMLCDYAWWVVLPMTAVWLWLRLPVPHRGRITGLFALGFVIVVTPWILRNLSLTGHPLALAGQDWVLKAGDPTAEPEMWRARFSTELPPVDWSKMGNKLLSHIRDVAQGKFWAATGILGAFALVGCLYRFRAGVVRDLRLWVIGLFLFMLLSEGVMGVGGEIRPSFSAFVPLVVLLGAGFFAVMLESHDAWRARVKTGGLILLTLQTLPIAHDLLEPRRIHYHYPPYYPALFAAFREEIDQRKAGRWLWQCDVPAGAAWYSGRTVWAKPSDAEGFLALGSRQPILALVLTPHTLDRPYFSELARSDGATTAASWTWPQIYRGLAQGHLPPRFPLQRIERFAPNLVVLVDGPGANRTGP